MIVKVQRPIMSNDPAAPWLIYDKGRKHVEQVPAVIIPAHVKSAMRDDLKGYFEGEWSSIVGWGLSKRVPDQSW